MDLILLSFLIISFESFKGPERRENEKFPLKWPPGKEKEALAVGKVFRHVSSST